jgi:hypothetical protein
LRKLYLSDAADDPADDMIFFPGSQLRTPQASHHGEQKKTNPYLKFSSLKQFFAANGYR